MKDKTFKMKDPNRDFPYYNNVFKTNKDCMETVAARTVNELMREHIFILSLTFHGGLNAIGYPWGNYKHFLGYKGTECPDYQSGRCKILIFKFSYRRSITILFFF